ncbi:DUF5684 domain-containing protein [Lachnoclostridium sp. Marseille-P6806]|uniref:DUF5684 domain-containing protein n=1 Tax=Lachnoclostridium sp. Marseille-P6806 TaxID=2364793 RepID=UPI001F5F10F1|nr:DUF5684 domain-containing protein [Lachnoclostridium sp. Marseille-P6806]
MYDQYSYGYAQEVSPALMLFYFAILALMIVCMWRIFRKAGKPGWASIVPVYNLYVMFEITWGKGILFLLLLVPFVNFIISIMTCFKLARSFGKGTGFALGLLFLGIVFVPVLAFGGASYIGADGSGERK